MKNSATTRAAWLLGDTTVKFKNVIGTGDHKLAAAILSFQVNDKSMY